MNTRPLATTLAALLTILFIVPSAFFVAPQRAQAQYAVHIVSSSAPTDIKTAVESTISAIKNALTEVHTYTSAVADTAQYINMQVLQPLAFVLSGNLMKTLTASVIGFVIGKANGTGVPQFATDIMQSMQTVSDSQALAYIRQFGTNSNSPFAYSISSALRTQYLSKTTLAGFWNANMCTLARTSPNVNGYLAGNWSQGGVATWFSLTTQTQNNPYILYQNSQDQLTTLVGPGVGGVTGARAQTLSWGQGFMSWCGATDAATQTQDSAATAYQQCQASGKSGEECQAVFNSAGGTMPSGGGINPGDPCTNKDGTPGTIQTPGTTIKATLDKVLGGQQDIVTRMGNVGPEINGILSNIATVMQTVGFASQILGGSGSGGLFGVAQASGSNATSRLMQYQNTPGTLGVTNSSIYQDAASIPVSGSNMLNQISQYQTAWNTIGTTATAASTSVASLASFCSAAADTAAQAQVDANAANGGIFYGTTPTDVSAVHSMFIDAARAQTIAAKTALSTEIAPVLAQAAAAAVVVASSTAQVQQLQSNLTSGADTAGSAYSAGIQTLQTMSPTMSDVANAQQDAQAFGAAVASPDGSLTVSAGSLVDQMNLISTNAAALQTTVCNPNSSLYVTQTVSGG